MDPALDVPMHVPIDDDNDSDDSDDSSDLEDPCFECYHREQNSPKHPPQMKMLQL